MLLNPAPDPEEAAAAGGQSDSDEFIGPKPIKYRTEQRVKYGEGFFKGEGEAMAKYIEMGKRIPRRGEIGMTQEEIQNYEDLGYVMSGSRHNCINQTRIAKELEVYTAQEKRALAALAYEKKVLREHQIINEM